MEKLNTHELRHLSALITRASHHHQIIIRPDTSTSENTHYQITSAKSHTTQRHPHPIPPIVELQLTKRPNSH